MMCQDLSEKVEDLINLQSKLQMRNKDMNVNAMIKFEGKKQRT